MQINWCCLRTFKARPEPRSRSLSAPEAGWGGAGAAWGPALAAHCQDDPGPGLTAQPHSAPPAADYCRCCAATVAVTTQLSAADHHDILTHCSPADRQTIILSYPPPTVVTGDGLGAGKNQQKCKCFIKMMSMSEQENPFSLTGIDSKIFTWQNIWKRENLA